MSRRSNTRDIWLCEVCCRVFQWRHGNRDGERHAGENVASWCQGRALLAPEHVQAAYMVGGFQAVKELYANTGFRCYGPGGSDLYKQWL